MCSQLSCVFCLKVYCSRHKLRDYLGDREFRISDFTVGFIKDYELHLRRAYDNHTNTIGKELKSFRRIINEAITDQVFPFEKSPFHRYKIKWAKTTKSFLIESEIYAIENFELTPGSAKELHRDMFIFACYADGMRVSDIYLLKWISYTGTHIIYTCRKTGERISVKLTKVAKVIIEKQRKPNQKLSDLIFPVLTLEESESKKLHKIINSRNSNANKTLRYIAKAIGLDKRVSFHTSRHSFATRALSKGMKIHHVSKLLGHASVKTTEVYAKIVDKDLDDAMDVFDE